MKICVCTLHINDWYSEVVKYGIRNMETYCNKHGYKFIHEDEHSSDTVYKVWGDEEKKRDLPWFKIKLIKKVLTENKDIDMVVWIDADTHILKMDQDLEHFVNTYQGDKDILLGTDYGNTLNTCVMFIRNTEFVRNFLDDVWDNPNEYNTSLHEQASMGELYQRNYNNCQDKMVILSCNEQNLFNTYWYMYRPGQCFIFHAARCAHDKEGFIYTMDAYCPIRLDEENDDQFNKRMEWLHGEQSITDIESWKRQEAIPRIPSARNVAGFR